MFFEETVCMGIKLINLVIIILLYANDIILLARHHNDLVKRLNILKTFFNFI